MTHRQRMLGLTVLAAGVLSLAGRAAGQTGLARTPAEFATRDSADIVGTWMRPVGTATQTLTINADGSGAIDDVQVKWHLSGDLLILSFSRPVGNVSYRVSVSGDTLTASGGELSQPLLYRRAGASVTPRTSFEAGDSDDGLPIAGTPPLTKELVQKETRCLEWLLNLELTAEQRAEFKDGMVETWKSHRQDKVDGYYNLVKLREQMEQKNPQEQDLLREGVLTELLASERQKARDPFSRWIVGVYDTAHRPIAAGNPPLTAHSADAYADMVAFIINDSLHRKALTSNRQFKDLVARVLVGEYGRYSAEQQNAIAQMPFLWKALRYMWPRLSESQRNTFREQWAPMVASLTAGAPGGAVAASNENNSSLDDWFARNREHMSLQPTFNSSFQSTMQLHMNMFH